MGGGGWMGFHDLCKITSAMFLDQIHVDSGHRTILGVSRFGDVVVPEIMGSVMLKIADFQVFQAQIHHCWG